MVCYGDQAKSDHNQSDESAQPTIEKKEENVEKLFPILNICTGQFCKPTAQKCWCQADKI